MFWKDQWGKGTFFLNVIYKAAKTQQAEITNWAYVKCAGKCFRIDSGDQKYSYTYTYSYTYSYTWPQSNHSLFDTRITALVRTQGNNKSTSNAKWACSSYAQIPDHSLLKCTFGKFIQRACRRFSVLKRKHWTLVALTHFSWTNAKPQINYFWLVLILLLPDGQC